MGSDARVKAGVCHQRLKLCFALTAMVGMFGILTSVSQPSKAADNKKDSTSVSLFNNPSMPSIPSMPSVPSVKQVMNSMNPSNFKFHNQFDVVHVVQTDFLQYQLQLNHINKARLDLFESFTIPSMKQQSTKEFLWLIWTDPKLGSDFKQELLKQVSPFPNVVVLGSRHDRELDFRELNGMSQEDLDDAIFYGSKDLLLEYLEAAQTRVLIETRLDADDALNKDYLLAIQEQTADTVGKSEAKDDFRIMCPEHHTEWRYYKPNEPGHEDGHLVHYHNPTFCINSGLSIGYQTEASSRHLEHKQQCNFDVFYHECLRKGHVGIEFIAETNGKMFMKCLDRARGRRRLDQAVLMSRTPTAAGMKRVLGTDKTYKNTFEGDEKQKEAWKMVEDKFAVRKDKVTAVRRSMEKNIENIIRDAITGQCMPGHSCKAATKRKLLKLLEIVENGDMKGVTSFY
jgi:hypothetical protein